MRSLSELQAAAVAGERLTAEEIAELARYETGVSRLMDGLRRMLPPEEQARAPTGDEAEAFIAEAITAMDALAADPDVAENAHVIDALARMGELVVMVRLLADEGARATGVKRRQRRENRDRQPLAVAAKHEKADAILAAVEAKKADRREDLPAVTDVDAARAVMRDGLIHDGVVIVPQNHAPSRQEVAALVQRVTHARSRKKKRH
jgi:hypothetical protein